MPKVILRRELASIYLNPSGYRPILELLNLASLAIVGTDRPDFRTISLFRKNHLDAFADVFVQVLRLAQAAGLVRLGTIAVDGTKMQGNASRHKAMSYGYMTKERKQNNFPIC